MSYLGNNSQIPTGMMANIKQVKNIMNTMGAFANPNQAINNVVKNNPQLQQVMQMCQGQNPQQMFYNLCKQRGIDPQAILKELQS